MEKSVLLKFIRYKRNGIVNRRSQHRNLIGWTIAGRRVQSRGNQTHAYLTARAERGKDHERQA